MVPNLTKLTTTTHVDTVWLTHTFKIHHVLIFMLFVIFFPPLAVYKERIPGRKHSSE